MPNTPKQFPTLSETVDDRILVRGRDLADDLMGRLTFTEMFLLDLHGEVPSAAHVRMVDLVLVTLMEHGVTPSTLAARLVLDGAPESTQGAIAAGLLAAGSRFLGVIEEVAAFLQRVVSQADGLDGSADGTDGREALISAAASRCVALARARGERIPGFGHNLHHSEDPRVERLTSLARKEGVYGPYLQARAEVHAALNEQSGRVLISNAAGVVGALLSDLGYQPREIRGFGILARCAGVFAHVVDEYNYPMARELWQRSHEAVGQDAKG